MTDKEVMQQALKCIERCNAHGWILADYEDEVYAAISALKAALEQPEQEPTPWRDMVVVSLVRKGIDKHKARELADHFAAERPWQGLTDEEMSDIVADMDVNFGDLLWKVVCLTKIIEAKLKGMNT